uniref:NADH-ubiquinone oxidoreductase chain 4L n=1 Tax=Loxocorone allax TaxID=393181 RepID=B1B1W4_LOXAA|nr:NADH dehydrogenase subunit 4L [Loxocorone allax]BAG12579.1 NADH dehydrogenase subunit 4L [Loxocorone allax]
MMIGGMVLVMYFLFFFSVVTFIINGKHLLSLLLALEAIMMGLFCFSVVIISFLELELFYCLVILTFSACEASIGLSVLVNMINSHGSSSLSSLSLIQC